MQCNELYEPKDGAELWVPDMPAPRSVNQGAFQKRIDDIVGTRDGRPIVKLAWAPDEKRWRPHAHGDDPPGYTFPIFIAYHDKDGNEIAAPRWVLLERLEPEQYAAMWEDRRYTIESDGRLWDWTGECPNERYVELWCHAYHDGLCCPCIKYGICACGEQYEHCWGKYLDPNERLLDWIREKAFEARQDSDVKPTEDIRGFEAPNAQKKLATVMKAAEEKRKEARLQFSSSMLSHWERKPHSTSGKIVSLS